VSWGPFGFGTGFLSGSCVAVFVHCLERPLGRGFTGIAPATDIDLLVRRNSQIGLRTVNIFGFEDPPEVPYSLKSTALFFSPEKRHACRTIEIHNPSASFRTVDLIFDFSSIPSTFDIAFRLFTKDNIGLRRLKVDGARLVLATHIDWFAVNRYELVDSSGGRSSENYSISPPGLAMIRNVCFPPYAMCYLELKISYFASETPSGEYWFQLQQRLDDAIIGGCQYLIRIPDRAKTTSSLAAK
jgi:hypothetical protein